MADHDQIDAMIKARLAPVTVDLARLIRAATVLWTSLALDEHAFARLEAFAQKELADSIPAPQAKA